MTRTNAVAPAAETQTTLLVAAKIRCDAARAEIDRIMVAMPDLPDVAATAAALEAVRRDFEDASAGSILGSVDESDLREATEALSIACAAHGAALTAAEKANVTRAGLERALEQARAEINAAAAELREAEVAWLRAELVEADKQYCHAADVLLAAWRRAKSSAIAIKSRGVRLNNYTELAGRPTIPPLAAWRDPKAHDLAMRMAGAAEQGDAEKALYLASIKG